MEDICFAMAVIEAEAAGQKRQTIDAIAEEDMDEMTFTKCQGNKAVVRS